MKKCDGLIEGADGLVYTAHLPLSSTTLNYLADLIRGHLKKIGSRWRSLPAGKIAAIVLAVLRCDQRSGDLAGGNGVHRTTVSRWAREVVGLLAAHAPRLDRALKKIAREGGGVVLLDGSLIRTRRRTGADNRSNYSGEHKCHGLLGDRAHRRPRPTGVDSRHSSRSSRHRPSIRCSGPMSSSCRPTTTPSPGSAG